MALLGIIRRSRFALARTLKERQLRRQLARVRAEDVQMTVGERPMGFAVELCGVADFRWDGPGVELFEVHPGLADLQWDGPAGEALRRLRSLPDDAGGHAFWTAFPERTSPRFRGLDAELHRIGVGEPPRVHYWSDCYDWLGDGLRDPLWLHDDMWDDEPPSSEIEWEWVGTTEEALRRLRRAPGGSGREGVWQAFPDRTRSYHRDLRLAMVRIGGNLPVGVGLRQSALDRVAFGDRFDAAPRWTWAGSVEEAMERLGRIANGAGRDGFWEAFPDRRAITTGRAATEIAADLDLPVEEVEQIKRSAQTPVSLEKSGGDEEESEFGHFLTDELEPLPDEAAEVARRREALLFLRYGFGAVSPRERQVLELRYGLDGRQPRTLDEVGRAFNVTRERIRRIEHQSLKKLRAFADAAAVRDVA